MFHREGERAMIYKVVEAAGSWRIWWLRVGIWRFGKACGKVGYSVKRENVSVFGIVRRAEIRAVGRGF